jgi:hypothetical protein
VISKIVSKNAPEGDLRAALRDRTARLAEAYAQAAL